jgi:hypothetical protein
MMATKMWVLFPACSFILHNYLHIIEYFHFSAFLAKRVIKSLRLRMRVYIKHLYIKSNSKTSEHIFMILLWYSGVKLKLVPHSVVKIGQQLKLHIMIVMRLFAIRYLNSRVALEIFIREKNVSNRRQKQTTGGKQNILDWMIAGIPQR